MTEIVASCTYFAKAGPQNSDRTLELAQIRAQDLGIGKAVVATTSGATGARAVEVLRGLEVVVVTHSVGFKEPNSQELSEDSRTAIEAAGASVLTCQHAFAGVGRAIRRKLGTWQVEEIMANTLRIFGQGVKVAAEIALMAADAGLVRTDEAVISIAGSGHGADTAVVLRPANAQDFFDLRFLEIICMPAPGHPGAG